MPITVRLSRSASLEYALLLLPSFPAAEPVLVEDGQPRINEHG